MITPHAFAEAFDAFDANVERSGDDWIHIALDADAHIPGPGQLLAGRFRLLEQLGSGGTSSVYRAVDLTTKRAVAAKVARVGPGLAWRAKLFELEGTTLAEIDHPNIVRLVSFGRTVSRMPYLCTELATGSVSEIVRTEGRLALDRVAGWGVQLLCALSAVHALDIVHRDVKPGNLLVYENDRLVLADFGTALIPDTTPRPHNGALVGTMSFMSPEQTISPHTVDLTADLYGAGGTLFTMLTSSTPYNRTTAEIKRRVPAPLADVVLRALSVKPEHRHADARAMALELAPHAPSELWETQPHLGRWLDPEST